ncbi:MAG: hypothetical protein JST64_00105 [Actinobacteria bacterium]|nr:hypothetical protein [Actinomycetota bacterium]
MPFRKRADHRREIVHLELLRLAYQVVAASEIDEHRAGGNQVELSRRVSRVANAQWFNYPLDRGNGLE